MLAAVMTLLLAPSVSATERVPAVVLVVGPKHVRASVSRGTIVSAAQRNFAASTRLRLESAEQAGVDENRIRACPASERVGCWSRATRAASREARFLVVIAWHASKDGADHLSVLLIDLDDATDRLDAIDSRDMEARQSIEDRLFEFAVQTDLVVVDTRRPAELDGYFVGLIQGVLRRSLESAHALASFGTIEIAANGWAPIQPELNGRSLGVFTSTIVTVSDVTTGHHVLRVVTKDEPLVFTAVVTRDRRTRIELPLPPKSMGAVRTALLWTGVGATAIGTAIAISSATAGDVVGVCLKRDPMDTSCPDVGAPSFGYRPGAAPTPNVSDVHSGGVPRIVLGSALLATGVTWALSAMWWGDVEDDPWLGLLLGLAAGGSTMLIGSLVAP